MSNLSTYQKKYGKRAGRKRYRVYCRQYRKKNSARINAAQRTRYRALVNGGKLSTV